MRKIDETLGRQFFFLLFLFLATVSLALVVLLVFSNPIDMWNYWTHQSASLDYYEYGDFNNAFKYALLAKEFKPSDKFMDEVLLFSHYKNTSLKLPQDVLPQEKDIIYGQGWSWSKGDSVVGKSFYWTDPYSMLLVKDLSPCQEIKIQFQNPLPNQKLTVILLNETYVYYYPDKGFFDLTLIKNSPSKEDFFLVELSTGKYRTCSEDPDSECLTRGIRVISVGTRACKGANK